MAVIVGLARGSGWVELAAGKADIYPSMLSPEQDEARELLTVGARL